MGTIQQAEVAIEGRTRGRSGGDLEDLACEQARRNEQARVSSSPRSSHVLLDAPIVVVVLCEEGCWMRKEGREGLA